MQFESKYGTQSPGTKLKFDTEGILLASPFLSSNESLSLLDSFDFVPLSDRVNYSSSDFGSEAASTDEREYLSSDSVSTASTDPEYASHC